MKPEHLEFLPRYQCCVFIQSPSPVSTPVKGFNNFFLIRDKAVAKNSNINLTRLKNKSKNKKRCPCLQITQFGGQQGHMRRWFHEEEKITKTRNRQSLGLKEEFKEASLEDGSHAESSGDAQKFVSEREWGHGKRSFQVEVGVWAQLGDREERGVWVDKYQLVGAYFRAICRPPG